MAENVFILGAGASLSAGAPLMAGFLDKTEDMLVAKEFGDKNDKLFEYLRNIQKLQEVQAKSYLDLNNIEDIFGALEMALVIKKFSEYTLAEIETLRNGLIELIVGTLERSIKFTQTSTNPKVAGGYLYSPHYYYQHFSNMVEQKRDFSVITFNYDVALDYALHENAKKIGKNLEYCLDPITSDGIKLLKLHGSVNWGKCSVCGQILEYKFDDFLAENIPQLTEDLKLSGFKSAHFEFSKVLDKLSSRHSHTGVFQITPAIVPPTWAKSEYRTSLANVWQRAATELGEARNIFIAGYSLPETDTFFRYLYSLGTVSPARIQRLWIINPDTQKSTFERYTRMVGADVKTRFRYYAMPFETFSTWTNAVVSGTPRLDAEYYVIDPEMERINETLLHA